MEARHRIDFGCGVWMLFEAKTSYCGDASLVKVLLLDDYQSATCHLCQYMWALYIINLPKNSDEMKPLQ